MSTFFRTARRVATRAALVPAMAVAFVACDDNPAPPEYTPDIVEIALVTSEVSTLATAIQAAGLADALKGDGPFTVFAPINGAFADLPAGELNRLLEAGNLAELQEILQFHVVSGEFLAGDLSEGATLPTLAGPSLTISLQGGASVTGAGIIATDIQAENGVIHLIDEVLLPPRPTIAGLATATAGLSSLVAALEAANLAGALAGDGPFTVFAPVNEAFAALGADVLAGVTDPANVDLLTKILTYHVVPGAAVYAGQLTDGQMVTTLQGEALEIGVAGGAVTVNGASVTSINIRASNGVVHLIDEVLVPELDIVEKAILTQETTTLAAAVAAGDLVAALQGDGPFTVFAPVNSAFAALGTYTIEALLDPANQAILQDVLTYHVIAGDVRASQLTDGLTATTVEGGEVTFDLSGATPKVNGANIIATDVVTGNGVIHLIDGVLTESLDVVQRAIITEQTSTLVDAVVAGDLVATLQGAGPFTVFAPINEAFAALGTDRLDVLLAAENQAILQKVLTYHVIAGDVRAAQLTDGLSVATVEGTEVTFDLSGATPKVNGANIIATDIVTENGVIHLIDGVLTESLDLVDVATVEGFPTLVALVEQQGLTATLRSDNGGDGFTVFAPAEAAFAALSSVPSGQALTDVLLYHVVAATVGSGDLSDGQVVNPALAGGSFTVNIDGASVTITDGTGNTVSVVLTDVPAKNGVIHVIDGVILPGN